MQRVLCGVLAVGMVCLPLTLLAKHKGKGNPVAGPADGSLPTDKEPVVLVLDAPRLKAKQFEKLAKCDEEIDEVPDDKGLPRNFRSTSKIRWLRDFDSKAPSVAGLDVLHCSGSAQYSIDGWNRAFEYLNSHGAGKIVVIDLRQEAHGFINNMAVSWYSYQDSINRGLPVDQVLSQETKRLQLLNDADEVTISKFTDKSFYDVEDWRTINLRVDVDSVRSEYEVITGTGCGYYRIAAPDYMAPEDEDVDRLVNYVRRLDRETWVHFHCCAGQGRTTTFMVMYDMMRNYKSVSVADIIRRQYLLGGIDLSSIPEDKPAIKQEWAKVRREFLNRFYQYCQAAGPDYSLSWSKWKAKNPSHPAPAKSR